MRTGFRFVAGVGMVVALMGTGAPGAEVKVARVKGAEVPPGEVEIRGVGAGPFDPKVWAEGNLHFVADVRHPMMEPRPGAFRNIYAPSVVQLPGGKGWRLFYGGWDGVPSGNDRIYSAETTDFLGFENRRTVIEHGTFQHVCNVTAVPQEQGGYALVCTGFPDEKGLNKPVFFSSPDGKTWNESPEPYAAKRQDVVAMEGYEKYAAADINGMNVIIREGSGYRLYFGNFRDFGRVYRASGTDGRHWTFDGPVLEAALAVNDVKRFRAGGRDWYLMGLHMNGEQIQYSVSDDGAKFPPARVLFKHRDAADRFMVAVGWVVDGEQAAEGRRLLGVLYGAGAVGSLDQNRIFARWLQKRVVVETAEGAIEWDGSHGPDAQRLTRAVPLKGAITVYDDDGKRLIGRSEETTLQPGHAYRITWDR